MPDAVLVPVARVRDVVERARELPHAWPQPVHLEPREVGRRVPIRRDGDRTHASTLRMTRLVPSSDAISSPASVNMLTRRGMPRTCHRRGFAHAGEFVRSRGESHCALTAPLPAWRRQGVRVDGGAAGASLWLWGARTGRGAGRRPVDRAGVISRIGGTGAHAGEPRGSRHVGRRRGFGFGDRWRHRSTRDREREATAASLGFGERSRCRSTTSASWRHR